MTERLLEIFHCNRNYQTSDGHGGCASKASQRYSIFFSTQPTHPVSGQIVISLLLGPPAELNHAFEKDVFLASPGIITRLPQFTECPMNPEEPKIETDTEKSLVNLPAYRVEWDFV